MANWPASNRASSYMPNATDWNAIAAMGPTWGGDLDVNANQRAISNLRGIVMQSGKFLNGSGAVVMMHDGSGNWTPYAPDGSVIATGGTTTQGLQEAITWATTNDYNLVIEGGSGKADSVINCSSTVVLPSMFLRSIRARGVTFNFGSTSATSACFTVDSMFMCIIDLRSCQIVNFGKGPCVTVAPTNNAPVDAQTVITQCPLLHFGTLVNTHTPTSDVQSVPLVKFDCTNGSIAGNPIIEFQELNGSGQAIVIPQPPAAHIFGDNFIKCQSVHGQTTGGSNANPIISVGASPGGQTPRNTWQLDIEIDVAGSRGVYTAASYDTWLIDVEAPGVNPDYAFYLDPVAHQNIVIAGRLHGGTGLLVPATRSVIQPGSYACGDNMVICGGAVSAPTVWLSAVLFASLPAAAASNQGQQAAISDSTTTTWGATVTGSGGSYALIQSNGTNWTVVGK